MNAFIQVRCTCIYRLTEGRLCGTRLFHACAVVCSIIVRAGANWPAGAEETQPLTLFLVTWVSYWKRQKQDAVRKSVQITQNIWTSEKEHLTLTVWLLVTVVQDDVSGVVDARSQILHSAFSKFVDAEDEVVHVRNTIYVVLKDIYAEGMEQV